MSEFQLPHPLQHQMSHQVIPSEFWPPGFGIHPPFNPSLLHQNIMPNYKLPNIQAILSQYMGNLGFFAYPQNLSVPQTVAAAAISTAGGSRVSPAHSGSPKDSPTHPDVEK